MSPKLFKTFSWIVLIVGAGAVISGNIDLDRWPKEAVISVTVLSAMLFFAPLKEDYRWITTAKARIDQMALNLRNKSITGFEKELTAQ
jgi:hypothetical protein